MAFQVGDGFEVERNQGIREGVILAVVDGVALGEYAMPAGTRSLLRGPADGDPNGWRSVSHAALSLRWLMAMHEAGSEFGGRAQQSGARSSSPTVAGLVGARLPVSDARLLDLLVGAVEGGSNYWGAFKVTQGTGSDYSRVLVVELERHGDAPAVRMEVGARELRIGLGRLALATFPAAKQHLADIIGESDDATTSDVLLQLAVFGDVIYG